jgi:hypothetical protein
MGRTRSRSSNENPISTMLPERRKSAEEIAKLRESLGIPGGAPEDLEPALPPPASFAPPSSPVTKTAAMPTAPVVEPGSPEVPSVVGVAGGANVGAVPIAGGRAKGPAPVPPLESPTIPEIPASGEVTEVLSVGSPKVVRSLRKSEQAPLAPRVTDPAAKVVRVEAAPLPQQRHSDRELMEMRRVQAAPPDLAISHIRHLAVPWPLIALGYLLPLTGALFAWLAAWTPDVPPMDFPAQWMADLSRQPWLGKAGFGLLSGLCGLGLLFAGTVAWKKPRSRHHAGFITIIAVLILAFGIIHHFSPTYGP